MSKAALIAVGIAAAIGVALAVKDADAAPEAPRPRPPSQDDPDADEGEVIPEPSQPPTPQAPEGEGAGPGPDPGSGSGAPPITSDLPGSPRAQLIPDQLRNINLSGNEKYNYRGISNFGPGFDFDTWQVRDGLNGMDMVIYASVTNPDNWISLFVHPDPPPSEPPFHYIIHKVHGSLSDWLIENLAHL